MKTFLCATALSLFASSAWAEEVEAAATKSAFAISGGWLVGLLILSLVIALIATSIMKGQMHTAEQKLHASEYIRDNSLQLDVNEDIFLYESVKRRKIEKEKTEAA